MNELHPKWSHHNELQTGQFHILIISAHNTKGRYEDLITEIRFTKITQLCTEKKSHGVLKHLLYLPSCLGNVCRQFHA